MSWALPFNLKKTLRVVSPKMPLDISVFANIITYKVWYAWKLTISWSYDITILRSPNVLRSWTLDIVMIDIQIYSPSQYIHLYHIRIWIRTTYSLHSLYSRCPLLSISDIPILNLYREFHVGCFLFKSPIYSHWYKSSDTLLASTYLFLYHLWEVWYIVTS